MAVMRTLLTVAALIATAQAVVPKVSLEGLEVPRLFARPAGPAEAVDQVTKHKMDAQAHFAARLGANFFNSSCATQQAALGIFLNGCNRQYTITGTNTTAELATMCSDPCGLMPAIFIATNATNAARCFNGTIWANWTKVANVCSRCAHKFEEVGAAVNASSCTRFNMSSNSNSGSSSGAAMFGQLNAYCNSECYANQTRIINSAPECFASRQWDGFRSLYRMCNGPAQCRSARFFQLSLGFSTTCGGVGSAFDFNNRSAAARAATNDVCNQGGSCNAMIRSGLTTYAPCFAEQDLAPMRLFMGLCAPHNGVSCAWRLRSFGDLTCGPSASNCTGGNPSSWCSVNGRGQCNVNNVNDTQLGSVCNPCLNKFILALSSGQLGKGSAAAAVGMMAVRDTLCAKVSGRYCMSAFGNTGDFGYAWNFGLNNISQAQASAWDTQFCSTSLKRQCIRKVAISAFALSRAAAMTAYVSCARQWNAESSVRAFCLPTFDSAMRMTQQSISAVGYMCKRNDMNTSCAVATRAAQNTSCWQSVFNSGTCSSTCDGVIVGLSRTMGCCWDAANRAFNRNSRYNINATPQVRLRGNNTWVTIASTNNFNASAFDSQHLAWSLTACASIASANFAANATRQCQGMTIAPPNRTLPLRGLRWSRLAADARLRTQIVASLRLDLSRTMGLAPEQIVNATLVEDTTQTLSATSRRQSNTTSGTKLEFQIVADSNSDASDAIAQYDSAVSSGELTVQATAEVITTECSNCVAAPTPAPAAGPAPATAPGATTTVAPPANLFAGLVGGPTSATEAPAASSASAVSAALALIAAIVVLF